MKLKTKLIALNTSVIFVVGIMMFLQFRSAQNKQKFEIRKGFSQSSEKLQKSISNVFYLYYHNVQNMALNSALQTKTFEGSNVYFNKLVSLYPLYDLIVYVDENGKFISSNSLNSSGKKINLDKVNGYDFSGANWFKSVKAGKLVEDYKKKLYGSFFGDFQKSQIVEELTGDTGHGNFFATAVNDELGKKIGYIATFVNGSWVTNELLEINNALEKEGKSGAKIWVTNSEGMVISEVQNAKYTKENFLKTNITKKYADEILSSKALGEPSFLKAMFSFDRDPLYAFSEFQNNKFIDSIGWKAFIQMESEGAFSAISVASNIFSISFVFILLFGSFMALLISNKLSNDLLRFANRIAEGSIKISDASGSLSEHSNNLSRATSEQVSNLQETAASLNEISAMVDKNTSASQSSKELSGKSREAAVTGKGTIDKMLSSIDEISDANTEIIEQMNQNAKEIQEIISVIREIEDKTKVINDIVFQTKLLSFNASVEAARAGEHGKGFSVVAEEVGNLAQHSGNAAKQIEEMLIQSVNRVESIAENTESKVQELIQRGTSKVEQGKDVARECNGALGEILDNANTLDNMIEEIAFASVEQSQGIQEITKAMSELDKVTKQNSMIAQETSLNTESLNGQVKGLKDISINLTDLITGKGVGTPLPRVDNKTKSVRKKNIYSVKGDRKVNSSELVLDTKVSKKELKVVKPKVVNQEKRKPEGLPKNENVISFKAQKEKIGKESKKVMPVAVPAARKKVASSDISIPEASDGEWEDI